MKRFDITVRGQDDECLLLRGVECPDSMMTGVEEDARYWARAGQPNATDSMMSLAMWVLGVHAYPYPKDEFGMDVIRRHPALISWAQSEAAEFSVEPADDPGTTLVDRWDREHMIGSVSSPTPPRD